MPLFIFVPVILYFIYQSFFTLGLTILAFGASPRVRPIHLDPDGIRSALFCLSLVSAR